MAKRSSFNLSISDDQVAEISIDVVGESQNILKATFIEEVNAIFDELEEREVKGVILTSAKPDTFIAGADINMLKTLDTKEAIAEVANAGYAILNRIENFKVPVIAEVHGACIGGGMELSLACHSRVASNDDLTRFALPEVQIGLLPGGGGTQRLPALVGIVEALTIMTTGRQIRAKKAKSIGLIDKLVTKTYLRQASLDLIDALSQAKIQRNSLSNKDWLKPTKLINHTLNNHLVQFAPVRDFILDKARKQVLAKTKGKYPAPLKIIDCVESWAKGNKIKGFETEAKGFSELVLSPEAEQLMGLFFAITDLKKEKFITGKTKPKAIHSLGVIGGGLMGSGIALVSAEKAKVSVRVQEMTDQAIDSCLAYSWKHLSSKMKKRRLKPADARLIQGRITGTLDYSGFSRLGLVIEAAFESLEVKHEVIKNIEKHAPKDVIIATNTSSIPIAEIAAGAKKPENVIGMHYFSPVEKMPLLEIIKTEQTSDKAIATAVDFGRKQGKTVIVVSDGAGFYTSRILAAYLNEAAHILSEGVAVDKIDQAMVNFGFPVGPFTLVDEVGIDVANKILPVLQNAFGERMNAPDSFDKLIAAGRLGKKVEKGFYDYQFEGDGPRPVDPSLYNDLGVQPNKTMSEQEIQERCHLILLNEASRCLEEGILTNPRDGDIGAIFGLGYPPFLGGPFKYMDSRGLDAIKASLDAHQKIDDKRFLSSDIISTKSSEKSCYY